jgi:hypothetical protein
MMTLGTGMFVIGEAVIDDTIGHVSFCCDLRICKGACCCISGGRGAPLEDEEVREIEKAYPIVKQYLRQKSIQTIEAIGLVDGRPGDHATACIEQQECVFVYFDDGIAKCSFERAWQEGKISWRKPISCHLFPIRTHVMGRDFVRYVEIDECAGGRKRGREEKIRLVDFLKEPLIRRFGEAWYNEFLAACSTS